MRGLTACAFGLRIPQELVLFLQSSTHETLIK